MRSHVCIGGSPALDFVNTVGGVRSGVHDEQLATYADLADWALAAAVVDPETAHALKTTAAADPAAAEHALAAGRSLREAAHNLFSAVTRNAPADPLQLAVFNRGLSDGLSDLEVAPRDGSFELRWRTPLSLYAPIWSAARSASDLLTGTQLARVRECRNETCGWFFLDTSRNGSRLWCDMAVCGNRHKVARYKRTVRARVEGPLEP